jgi:hypothetical protein
MEKQTAVEFLARFPEILGKSGTTSSKDILINPINQGKQMTPKEKAEELVDKFRNEITSFLGDNMKKINAKKCALVAVDELIKIHYLLTTTHDTSPSINYWKEVKKEIQNL